MTSAPRPFTLESSAARLPLQRSFIEPSLTVQVNHVQLATELVNFIENWLQSEGTLLYNKFHLWLAQNCSLRIESFSEVECEGDRDTAGSDKSRADEGRDLQDGGLLLGPSTCYRFQSCGDEQGMRDTTKDSTSIGSADYNNNEY